jgi:glycosyltransferase involved in cell wall biosynthesis
VTIWAACFALLIAVSTLIVTYWGFVMYRVWVVLRDKPTVRAGLALAREGERDGEGLPLLSIIVPAHNEERVIDACCAGLRQQTYSPLEIIFVLDRCTDRTLEIVRRHAEEDERIIVIENDSCPDDWAGKCNAARLGADRARGELLLFTDADTAFDPQLAEAAVALARERDLALLSLLSDLTFEHEHERIAQPVATMALLRMYPLKRFSKKQAVRPFANGQFLLFARKWYERIGGHSAVKDDLLEDIAFARQVRTAGGETGIFLADGMLRCSMYGSFESFRDGWKRIFIEACRRRPRRMRFNGWRLIFSGIAGPMILVGAIIMGLIAWTVDHPIWAIGLVGVGAIGLSLMAVTLGVIYRAHGAPLRAVLRYPQGCWIVAHTMFEGARDLCERKPVRWGGREYVLEPRN